MAWIKTTSEDDATGRLKEIYTSLRQQFPIVPNIMQSFSLKPEVLAEYEKQIPVGRIGRPEDVAHAVLFFACAESGYITGQTLPITGGWF